MDFQIHGEAVECHGLSCQIEYLWSPFWAHLATSRLNSSRRSDLVSLKIREAGHIYDLAASHPDDLPDVRKVRPS